MTSNLEVSCVAVLRGLRFISHEKLISFKRLIRSSVTVGGGFEGGGGGGGIGLDNMNYTNIKGPKQTTTLNINLHSCWTNPFSL